MAAPAARDAYVFRRRGVAARDACDAPVVTSAIRRARLLTRRSHGSHCKPWRDASDQVRLDGENGLLLTPDVDLLFDRGFMSFDVNGDVLLSPIVHELSLEKMGLTSGLLRNVGAFSDGQKQYLDFHRNSVFLTSRCR
jgi:putative restriction endonuclease